MKTTYNQCINFIVNYLTVVPDILPCIMGLSSFPICKLDFLPIGTKEINKSRLHIQLEEFTDFCQILGDRMSRRRIWSGDDSDGGGRYCDGDDKFIIFTIIFSILYPLRERQNENTVMNIHRSSFKLFWTKDDGSDPLASLGDACAFSFLHCDTRAGIAQSV
jgi:hypothetical protein